MSSYKFKVFISTFNLLLCIVGYQFITSLFASQIDDQSQSQLITLPYRVFALIVCLVTIFINWKSKSYNNLLINLFWIFWLLVLIRFFHDMYLRSDVNIPSSEKFRYLLFMFPITIFEMYSIQKSYKYINFRKLLKYVIVFFSISCILSYFNNPSYQYADTIRVDANFMLNTISAGHMGLSTLFLIIYVLIVEQNSTIKKIILFIVGIVSVVIWLRSGSRGPLLTGLVLFFIWALILASNNPMKMIKIFLIFCMMILLKEVLFSVLYKISPVLFERIFETESISEFSNGRDILTKYALNIFYEHPLLGGSFGVYNSSKTTCIYAHNIFVDTLMQLGIVGFIPLLFILYNSIKIAFKYIKLRKSYYWIALLYIQNLMMLMTSGAIYFAPLFSVLTILIFLPLDQNIADHVQK